MLTSGNTCAALILAGGQSRRMNFPKAFLRINGRTFLENIVSGYFRAGIRKIAVVMNAELIHRMPVKLLRMRHLQIIPNAFPELGRFYSLRLGLQELMDMDYTFIHNSDNPYVEEDLLRVMCDHKSTEGYVVPVYNGQGGHPVLLSNHISSVIVSNEKNYDTLRETLANFSRVEVEAGSPHVLVNINTRKEYESHIERKLKTVRE
jgi:CTP:molybdopterin cytidylyltransferase MocA